jgi:hypothetical protein
VKLDDGEMMKVRTIYSSLDYNKDPIELPQPPVLTNLKLNQETDRGKVESEGLPFENKQILKKSAHLKAKKDIILSRKHRSLKPSPKFSRIQKRMFTSQRLHSDIKHRHEVPHLNFPDPIPAKAKDILCSLRNSTTPLNMM